MRTLTGILNTNESCVDFLNKITFLIFSLISKPFETLIEFSYGNNISNPFARTKTLGNSYTRLTFNSLSSLFKHFFSFDTSQPKSVTVIIFLIFSFIPKPLETFAPIRYLIRDTLLRLKYIDPSSPGNRLSGIEGALNPRERKKLKGAFVSHDFSSKVAHGSA